MIMRPVDAHRASVDTVVGRRLPLGMLYEGSGGRWTRPLLPKPLSKLKHVSRSRITPASDLVPARPGQTRK